MNEAVITRKQFPSSFFSHFLSSTHIAHDGSIVLYLPLIYLPISDEMYL